MTTPTEKPLPQLLANAFVGWAIPALLGAFFAMLISNSGQAEKVAALDRRQSMIEQEVQYFKQNYTPVRQTEGLQQEIQDLRKSTDSKLDALSKQLNDVLIVLNARR